MEATQDHKTPGNPQKPSRAFFLRLAKAGQKRWARGRMYAAGWFTVRDSIAIGPWVHILRERFMTHGGETEEEGRETWNENQKGNGTH